MRSARALPLSLFEQPAIRILHKLLKEVGMLYRDLRGWLDGVESFGELRVVEGADWNQEIGAVAEVAARSETPPAVLFDKIKDYPAWPARSNGHSQSHPQATVSDQSPAARLHARSIHRRMEKTAQPS